MGLSAADYQNHLAALLPPGPAWPSDDGGDMEELLLGLAQELARIDARVDDLIAEADPRYTQALLSEWERVLALPDVCITAVGAQSTQERRSALVSKLIQIGGQSAAYYIAVAAALGFSITITEFNPFVWTMPLSLPMCGMDWQFVWQVNAPLVSRRYWLCTDPASDPMSTWGNGLLECVLNRIKPAHTLILFSYT
jgi:uncharacterized protein YmfQ (DUF2313 family)